MDHGTGGSSVGTRGVTATGWISGGNVYERAFYVNALGTTLYERKLVNGVADSSEPWRAIAPPSNPVNKTLTKQIAAAWNFEGGVVRVRLFATTTDHDVYVYSENTSTGLGTWSSLALGGYSTSAPLAASQSPDGAYARVFASNDANTNIQMFRHNGVAWSPSGYAQGQPAGQPVCGTAAAVEDQIDGSTYRGFLFCTRTAATNAVLYYAWGDSASDMTWSWGSLPLPAGNARNSGYALSANSRQDGDNRAIDAFLVDTSTNPTRLYHTERVSGSGLSGLADLGADGETYRRPGALASTPTAHGYSLVFFVGEESGAFSQRLYRRIGDESAVGTDPFNWANEGAGAPTATVSGTATPHSESSTATWNRYGITAAIVRPTPAADARVETMWSTNDGDTWLAPQDFPEIIPAMEYMTDPTVDFDDSGTAYVLVQNIDWLNACGQFAEISQASAFYRSTTDGILWSAATEIVNAGSVDHPWMAIDRLAGADRMHFVWSEILSGTRRVHYRNRLVGGALSGPVTLADGGAPFVTVGAGNTVWVGWLGGHICRLTAAYTMCSGAPVSIPGLVAADVDVQGTDLTIRTTMSWSMRASMSNANKLYIAFQKLETNGDGLDLDNDEELDVYLTVATYDPLNLNITFSPAAPLTVTNDDADQFAPAVVTTRDEGSSPTFDNVFASWYDRRAPTPGCPESPNRCYRAKRSRSFNGGAAFLYTQDIPVDGANSLSDPALLPPHCGDPDTVFIGDYHDSRGELLHTRHVVVGAPLGSEAGTATLTDGWASGGWWYW